MKLTQQRKWIRALFIGTALFSSCTSGVSAPQTTQVADRVLTQVAQAKTDAKTTEATIDCSIDSTPKTATCTISTHDYETITWSSNANSSTYRGGIWIFQLEEPTTDLLVQLELCDKGECRTIQASFNLPPELRAIPETQDPDKPKPQANEAAASQVPPTQTVSIAELPVVHIDCGDNSQFVGEDIVCSLDQDNAQRVNWTAVGASRDYSDHWNSFITHYVSAGKYIIVLEACNDTGCVTKTQELHIINKEPNIVVTPTRKPKVLAVACSFDPSVPEISCQASGYEGDGSQLRWETNVSGWDWGTSYQVQLVKPGQLVNEALISLKECIQSTCQTVDILIDTSILLPGKSVAGRGSAELLDVDDGLAAWLSQDTLLYAVSITNPSSPSIMGIVKAPEHASAAFQDNEYLYTGGSDGLNILRAADPLGEPVGTLKSRIWPSTIMTKDGYAYITKGDDLLVLDISDPSEPVEASRLKLAGRHPTNVQLQGGYAYIPATLGGLNVIDVTNPLNPRQVAAIPFESHSLGFKIIGSFGYLARIVSVTPTERWYEASSMFEVLDLSVPHSPKTIGSVTIPTMIEDLDIVGNYAYVTGAQITGPDMLTIIDISSPSNPKAVDFPKPEFGQNNFHDIYINDGYAYIMDSGRGIRVLNIDDPLTPTLVTTLEMPQTMYCMHGAGETIYLCAQERYLNVAEVDDPENPVMKSSTIIPPGVFSYSSIVLKDKKAFFNGIGLQVYDLSDPGTPEMLPVYISGVDTIAIQGELLYSTLGEWGLDIWDITDLFQPTFVSRTNFPIGMPHDMSHDGKWVVGIANKPYSITVIDVSDPFVPVVTDSHVFDDYADTVTVKDNRVYVPRGSAGVDIFDISSAGILTLVANYPTGSGNYVTVSGNRAYVLGGIDVVDINDPSQPALLGHLPSYGIANRAKVHEGYLYLADGYAGLTVLPLEPSEETQE